MGRRARADHLTSPSHRPNNRFARKSGESFAHSRTNAGMESILGLRLQGGVLHLDPCIPCTWPSFEVSLRHGSARYEIRIENPGSVGRGIAFATIDEKVVMERPLSIRLADDGVTHRLQVRLG